MGGDTSSRGFRRPTPWIGIYHGDHGELHNLDADTCVVGGWTQHLRYAPSQRRTFQTFFKLCWGPPLLTRLFPANRHRQSTAIHNSPPSRQPHHDGVGHLALLPQRARLVLRNDNHAPRLERDGNDPLLVFLRAAGRLRRRGWDAALAHVAAIQYLLRAVSHGHQQRVLAGVEERAAGREVGSKYRVWAVCCACGLCAGCVYSVYAYDGAEGEGNEEGEAGGGAEEEAVVLSQLKTCSLSKTIDGRLCREPSF